MRTITYELSIPRLAFTKALGTIWRGAYFAPTSALRLNDLPHMPLPVVVAALSGILLIVGWLGVNSFLKRSLK